MKLYEFEGHKLFAKVGLKSPFFVVVSDFEEVREVRKRLKFPIVAKVQVLSGKRGKAGGVKVCTTEKQLLDFAEQFLGQEFPLNPPADGGGGEKVQYLELSEKVDIEREYYLSITYDTKLRAPFILFSFEGGVDIEEVSRLRPEKIRRIDFDVLTGPAKKDLSQLPIPEDVVLRLWDAFNKFDARLVEINPLAETKNNEYIAVDAKVILDDAGIARHADLEVLPKGAISAVPSQRELAAHEIDREDYRGSAGSTFIELDGDIAILASGGGASLLVVDSVVAAGGSPANYTEYSGNPPREKVEKLTKITLDREGLSGCLVAGAVANFTDIYETLIGFMDGLREVRPKPDYPIVIRRGGPRQKEAYTQIEKIARKEGFDIHLFGPETPISVACRKMVELASQYKDFKSKR